MFTTIMTGQIPSIVSKFNPLTDDKFLAFCKFKGFADVKFIVAQMVQFFTDKIINIVGKGENACYHHFILFPQCFRKASSSIIC